MDFKTSFFIAIGILLSFDAALNADSGRNSSRRKRSTDKANVVAKDPIDRKEEQNDLASTVLRVQGNAIASQEVVVAQLSSKVTFLRDLLIASLFFTCGLALLTYCFWSRNRLRTVSEQLAKKTKVSKDLQERITQMQRTESLGMLASGVAHDFNNLLVGVLCNAELLEIEFEQTGSEPVQQRIGQIIQSAEKAADLSRQMLAYAGKTQIIKVPTELNTVISRLQSVLLTTAGQNAQLELDLSPDQIVASIAATQIEQILLNLVSNASQASGESGEIIIRTGSEFLESVQADSRIFGSRDTGGQFVFFEVQDTGIGISDENLQHVFDPFYTSKDEGRGLGLAVVFGFVKSHDGLIRVTTTPGEGTCFRILLPASDEVAMPYEIEKTTIKSTPTTINEESLTVLIIDDEAGVRNTAKALLESIGWEAIVASNGEEGLRILDETLKPIDCVLLDVMMPQMSGKQVLEHMQLRGEKACIILMSGRSEEQLAPYQQDDTVSAILSKPFKTQELLDAVSLAVEKRHPAK